ncbi:MAG: ACT domain-containing protein [Pseudomonadales bacterium]
MIKSLIFGFIGQDRPGLVQKLTEIVSQHGGNWQESRMASLSGVFSGIARVEVEGEDIAALTSALEALEAMTITVRQPPDAVEATSTVAMTLNIIGPDRAGILREVTNALSRSIANVVELETRVGPAPMSGELTFYSDAIIEVPVAVNKGLLVERLNEIGADLGVDILLDEIPDNQ